MTNSFSSVGGTLQGHLMDLTWTEWKQKNAFIGLKFSIFNDCFHYYLKHCYVHLIAV